MGLMFNVQSSRVPETCRAAIFVRVRKIERWIMIAAAALQRLLESLGTGGRVNEKGIGAVDGRDEDGTSWRSLRYALSGSGYHRYRPSPKTL